MVLQITKFAVIISWSVLCMVNQIICVFEVMHSASPIDDDVINSQEFSIICKLLLP